jgi:hypothetical protein
MEILEEKNYISKVQHIVMIYRNVRAFIQNFKALAVTEAGQWPYKQTLTKAKVLCTHTHTQVHTHPHTHGQV